MLPPAVPLSSENKKRLRHIGHNLRPVVTIAGNGLSEGVMKELNRALDDHELIKVKIAVAMRDQRKALVETLCRDLPASIVQEIGKVALIYRPSKQHKLPTSRVREEP